MTNRRGTLSNQRFRVPIHVTDGVGATQFDRGGEGVAYHDTEAANLGGAYRPTEGVDIQATGDGFHPNVVSFVKAGEWLEYTMDFTQSGPFNLNVRAASLGQSGSFRVLVDGQSVATFSSADTGGWQSYKTLTKSGVNVAQGRHRNGTSARGFTAGARARSTRCSGYARR